MNDIYWHDKRTMSSKQISSAPPTQPRRAYENTLRTKQYQHTDVQVNSHSKINRNIGSPYLQYQTVSNRSHNANGDYSYASSLYGVYRQPPPPTGIMTSSSPLHSSQNRRVDPTNHSQQSHSVSEPYYTSKYPETNGYNDEVYDDDDDNNEEEEEESTSEVFNYTFNDAGFAQQYA